MCALKRKKRCDRCKNKQVYECLNRSMWIFKTLTQSGLAAPNASIKSIHVRLERRKRQTPKQVFCLFCPPMLPHKKYKRKVTRNVNSPLQTKVLISLWLFTKTQGFELGSTYFYLYLLVFTCNLLVTNLKILTFSISFKLRNK